MQKLILSLFVILAACVPVNAGTITASLGNTTPGFSDGDFLALASVTAAQAGQPAPFDAGLGNELFGPNGSANEVLSKVVFLKS